MHMPTTSSMHSVSRPISATVSHLSRTWYNCGTAISKMAATETKIGNRRDTPQILYQMAHRCSELSAGAVTSLSLPLEASVFVVESGRACV